MPTRYRDRSQQRFPTPPDLAHLVQAFRADGRRAATTLRIGQTVVNLSLKGEVTSPQGATGRVIVTAQIYSGGADVTIDAAWLTAQAQALGLIDLAPYPTPLGVAIVGRIPNEEQVA